MIAWEVAAEPERFFVLTRTDHAPVLEVIYAERTRKQAEKRCAAWERRGIAGARTIIVHLRPI